MVKPSVGGSAATAGLWLPHIRRGHQRPGRHARPVAHQEGGLVPVLWRPSMRRTRETRVAWR